MEVAPPDGEPRRRSESRVLRRFGDEQSTLLDRFERLSFEAHLNMAMLARSRSTAAAEAEECGGGRGSRLSKVLKKLLKPTQLCRRKGRGGRNPEAPSFNPINWKAFSRSLRFF